MIYFENASIHSMALHHVGNKASNEIVRLSTSLLEVDDLVGGLLLKYFSTPFTKSAEYFQLYHESDLMLNEVYHYAKAVFDEPGSLLEQSGNLARHLHEQSTHPRIKAGEFYVVYFSGCVVDGEEVDALGLFKSENKDTFLKVYPQAENFEIESQEGININKLDKGCLIFNQEAAGGYQVVVVDNTNKGTEAHYWIDDFLHVRQRQDEYYNTQNTIALCKAFATEQLPAEYNVSKADQVDFMNKSLGFFREKENFSLDEFACEVIVQPEVIESFSQFKQQYQQEHAIEIANSFDISDNAVKKNAKALKSVIKLDKNFHIYIHGDREWIRKGVDEATGMNYYQLLFKNEE